jgi:ribosomal protein L37E
MKQIFYVGLGGQKVLEILQAEALPRETVVAWLREAVDSLNGDTINCLECSQLTYKHLNYVCQDCGEGNAPRLRLLSTKDRPCHNVQDLDAKVPAPNKEERCVNQGARTVPAT